MTIMVAVLALILPLIAVSMAAAAPSSVDEPVVRAKVVDTYWEGDDASTGLLNVTWKFTNVGSVDAYEERILFTCSDGVVHLGPGDWHAPSLILPGPTLFYSLKPGESTTGTMHFTIPDGVTKFTVTPSTATSIWDDYFMNGYPLYRSKTPNGTWTIHTP